MSEKAPKEYWPNPGKFMLVVLDLMNEPQEQEEVDSLEEAHDTGMRRVNQTLAGGYLVINDEGEASFNDPIETARL